ncbi:MAG: saccharopine dehydrogenase C-terminal domain-containing protein [Bacteroidia bacterium]
MKKKIIVIGCGMVGSAIAIELSKKYSVTITDRSDAVLKKAKSKCEALEVLQLDVTDKKKLTEVVGHFDLLMLAVPGFLGYQTLKTIIEAKKNVVDISFFPENALELDSLAKENKVTAIVDCGVAPGLDNMILGYWNEKIKVMDFECLVGGLPKNPKPPFNYKAPFSPVDVIEEYTRPARFVENGKLVTKEPLTDRVIHDFKKAGKLESFNSDGLRSLIFSFPNIPNMKEKTLRYPGHAESVSVLKDSGFFNTEKMNFGNEKISPLEFSSKILFNEWKLVENEEEFTIMRISVSGKNEKNEEVKIVYEIFDEYNSISQTSSMARTTGYTACAAANLFLDGTFSGKGIIPPEKIGKDEKCFEYVLNYLKGHGIQIEVR